MTHDAYNDWLFNMAVAKGKWRRDTGLLAEHYYYQAPEESKRLVSTCWLQIFMVETEIPFKYSSTAVVVTKKIIKAGFARAGDSNSITHWEWQFPSFEIAMNTLKGYM